MQYVERTQVPEQGNAIPSNEVHVYTLDFDQPWHDDFASLLNEDEQTRAARYAIDAPRRQFIQTRGSLRLVISKYLHCEPRSIEIVISNSGKPILSGNVLHFNVAHSSTIGVIAVASHPVGVDVEVLRQLPNALNLVDRFFSELERKQYTSLPNELRMRAFFRGWTAKEALLKAVGVGLAGLDDCVVDLDPRLPPRIVRFRYGTHWQLDQRETAGAVVCTAVES